MVLILHPRKHFFKHSKNVCVAIAENGFGTNSLKSLARLLLSSGKALFKSARPKKILFAEDTFAEVKPKLQK